MMDRKEALDFLMAFACCTSSFRDMCGKCPWNGKYECVNSKFEADLINEAIDVIRKGENKNMRKMKLSDIKITSAFSESIPSENKMKECRDNWDKWHRQDRYLVVNTDGFLIDGYVQYLVLKENNIEDTEVKISNRMKKRWCRKNTYDGDNPRYRNEPTTYVYGMHPNSKDTKTYMWRVPKNWTNWAENIQIGDTIICSTKNGYAPVIVNKVEILDECPVDIPVKKVCDKKIRRNGIVVKI